MPDAALRDRQPVALTVEGRGAALEQCSEIEGFYESRLNSMRDSRYVDYPNQIGLESRALCNATCDFCPYPTMRRKGERMPDELVAKIINEMSDLPSDLPFDVNLARMNEPFADKRVLDIANEITTRYDNASLWFFTNASPLVPRVVERLERIPRITQFVVSLNEHRPAHYERVMGLRFERTTANLDHIHELHDSGRLGFTPTISKVGDGTDADEAFLAWTRARWPTFSHRVTGRFDWRGNVAIGRIGHVPAMGCWQWFHLPILASGRVAYCTLDHEGDHAWGDTNDTHILDIYNQPMRRALRLRTPDRHDVENCSACTHYG